MIPHRKLATALMATCALMLAVPALAGATVPTTVPGNFNCINLSSSLLEIRVEPPNAGTFTSADGKLKVRIFNNDGKEFDWESLPAADGQTRGVDAVMVKGGTDTNQYLYDPPGESFGDTDLHAPNTNSGSQAGLSHISFCYDLEQRISGVKYEDLNGNGSRESGEPVVSGSAQQFTFYIDNAPANGQYDQGEATAVTNSLGAYSFEVAPGTYTVRELDPDGDGGWTCSTAAGTCNYTVTLGLGESSSGNDFGNWRPVSISGVKREDLTGDGQSQDDTAWDGVTIMLDPGTPDDADDDSSTTTGSDGSYSFTGLTPGVAYRVYEVAPDGSVCTYPSPCAKTWTAAEASSNASLSQDFANFVPEHGVEVVKSVDEDLVHVGDLLTYTITVTNTGNTAIDVALDDTGCAFAEGTDLTFGLAASDGEDGGADEAQFSCTKPAPDADSYTNTACVESSSEFGKEAEETPDDCDDASTDIIDPAIAIKKSVDKDVAHAGDLLTYEIVVSNTGNTSLDVTLTDTGCTFPDETDLTFTLAADDGEEGGADEATFSCTKEAPDAPSYENEACVDAMDELGGEKGTIEDVCSTASTRIIEPAIDVTKSVDKATARAGETLTYTIVVSNPSNTGITVQMTDLEKGTAADGCVFPAGTSMTFELAAGGSRQFTCTQAMPDQETYVNEVCVTGMDELGGPKGTAGPECAEAVTTIVRDPAPPEQVVAPTVEEPPGQVVLGERIAPGAARLLGPTGCRGTAFRARVAGSKIARVVFTLDGKRLATLSKPNFRGQFAVRINPAKLKVGVHRLVATTTFERGSSTRPKTMRLSFQRCARALQAPRFTG